LTAFPAFTALTMRSRKSSEYALMGQLTQGSTFLQYALNKNSNDRLETKPVDKNAVIEWAPFTLVEGIDEEKLLQASQALQTDFLSKQKGFLGRELLKGKGNDWVDLVYWENREAAEQASQNAANSPVCYAYFQLMGADHAEPGAGVMHFEQVKTYKA
jgi:hypothetical protein